MSPVVAHAYFVGPTLTPLAEALIQVRSWRTKIGWRTPGGYRSFSALLYSLFPTRREAMMRHCLMYQGGFERNFNKLKSGVTTFDGTDGTPHSIPTIPAEVDGVCVGYMEKAGKKFAAVRVMRGKDDVVLKHELRLDPARHMGYGKRFSPEPTIVDDEMMAGLLGDIMAANPEQKNELAKIRSSFSVTGKASH
jgi:hypothetical protein